MAIFALVWLCCIVAAVWISVNKGFVVWPAVLATLLLGVIAVAILAVMKPIPGSAWANPTQGEPLTGSTTPVAGEIAQLAALMQQGLLTEEEFQARKARLLDS